MTAHTETAPAGTPERLRNSVRCDWRNSSEDTHRHFGFQAPITLTAIPWDDARWAMKAVSPEGTVRLPGIFHTRLEALGACVLLAAQCGGDVQP